jgi:hypothetical protein
VSKLVSDGDAGTAVPAWRENLRVRQPLKYLVKVNRWNRGLRARHEFSETRRGRWSPYPRLNRYRLTLTSLPK